MDWYIYVVFKWKKLYVIVHFNKTFLTHCVVYVQCVKKSGAYQWQTVISSSFICIIRHLFPWKTIMFLYLHPIFSLAKINISHHLMRISTSYFNGHHHLKFFFSNFFQKLFFLYWCRKVFEHWKYLVTVCTMHGWFDQLLDVSKRQSS